MKEQDIFTVYGKSVVSCITINGITHHFIIMDEIGTGIQIEDLGKPRSATIIETTYSGTCKRCGIKHTIKSDFCSARCDSLYNLYEII